jgi:hypothetical protein
VISPFVLLPLSTQLDREEHRLATGTTIVVITGIMPPELGATLRRLERRGAAIIVMSTTGARWEDELGSIPVRDVSPEALGAPAWSEDASPWAARAAHTGPSTG